MSNIKNFCSRSTMLTLVGTLALGSIGSMVLHRQYSKAYLEKQKTSYVSTDKELYPLSDITVLNIDDEIKLCETRYIEAADVAKLQDFDILYYDDLDSVYANTNIEIGSAVAYNDVQENIGYFLVPTTRTYTYDDGTTVEEKCYSIRNSVNSLYDIETGEFVGPEIAMNSADTFAVPSWVIPKHAFVFNKDDIFDTEEVKTYSKKYFD